MQLCDFGQLGVAGGGALLLFAAVRGANSIETEGFARDLVGSGGACKEFTE